MEGRGAVLKFYIKYILFIYDMAFLGAGIAQSV
jgi:hypothetical protein